MTDREPEKLVYLSAEEVRLLPAGYRLTLNIAEEIVILLPPEAGRVVAACVFPHNAFRALIILLKSPRGASYAEIYAAMRCPENVIRQILAAPAADQSEEFQVYVGIWQQHLEQVALKGNLALERELKPVRRAVREKRSVHTLGRENGFGWRVRIQTRRGYQLLRAPIGQVSGGKPPDPAMAAQPVRG
jgi:hypothetical protein